MEDIVVRNGMNYTPQNGGGGQGSGERPTVIPSRIKGKKKKNLY